MRTLFLILLLSLSAFAQSDLPVIGELKDIAGFTKVYVATDEADSRTIILYAFKREKRFTVVNDPADAQFIFEVKPLSQLVNSREYQARHEGKAYILKDGKKIIVWSDTETFYHSGGLSLNRPNEFNIVTNLHKALKKAKL